MNKTPQICKYIQLFLFIFLMNCFYSCSKKEPDCSRPVDLHVSVNGEKLNLDENDSDLFFRCHYDSSLDLILIAVENIDEKIGGIEVNNIGAGIRTNELKEGIYSLVRNDEIYCSSREFVSNEDEAIADFRVSECCHFRNDISTVEIFECEGRLYVHIENTNFTESECEIEQGGGFNASFQIPCNWIL